MLFGETFDRQTDEDADFAPKVNLALLNSP